MPEKAIPTSEEELTSEEINSNLSEPNPESEAALTALLEEATGSNEEAEEKAAKEAEEKAAKEAEEKAAKEAEEKAAKEAEEKAAKEAEEKAAKGGTPQPQKSEFESVELPPNAKPKTAESFERVKGLARQEIQTLSQQLSETKRELEAAKEAVKSKGELPPEVKKELEELREFRQKVDVENDPTFKTYDQQISDNVESIYAKLKSAGTSDEVIAKIKELGGPSEVDWDSVAEKLPATMRRYIEGKIFENDDLAEKRRKALDKAKSQAAEFLKAREAETGKSAVARKQRTEAFINQHLSEMKWLNPVEVPEKGTEAEKANAAAVNKKLSEIKEVMSAAVSDESPETKAALILGYAQLQRVRADFEAAKAVHKAEVEKLSAELKEKTTLLEKIKKSSTARFRESPVPAAGDPATKKKVDFNEPAPDALSRLRQELEASKE